MFNEKISGISGVAPGGKALVPLETERRVFKTTLRPSGTFVVGGDPTVVEFPDATQLAEQIDLIEVIANTSVLQTWTVPQLIAANAEKGIAFVNGFLPLQFADPARATVLGEEATALPLYLNPWGVKTFTIRVRFSAAAVAPSLTASVDYDFDPQVNSAGQSYANIINVVPYTVQVNGAGKKDFNLIETSGIIQRLMLLSPNVSEVLAKVGARTVWEDDLAGVAERIKNYKGVVVADAYQLNFDYRNVLDDGLNTQGNALKLSITYEDAGDYVILAQQRYPRFFR